MTTTHRLRHGRIVPVVPLLALSLTVGCYSPMDSTSESGQAPVFALFATNEPPGYTPITDRAFNAKVEDAWTATDAITFTIESDSDARRSPSSVGQMLYPAGCLGSCDPGWTELAITQLGYTQLYVSFWVKVSDDWQGHDSFFNKIGFIWTHGKPVVVPVIKGKDADTLRAWINLQDIPEVARNLEPNLLDDVEIVRGRWHRWEIILIANSGDNADGQVHWWVDDVKVGEYFNVAFGSATQSKIWELIAWRPIWGGQGDVVLLPMYMRMDHYYASGAA